MLIPKRGAYKLLLRKIIKKHQGNFYLLPFKVRNGHYLRFEMHGSFACGYYVTHKTAMKILKSFRTSIEDINEQFVSLNLGRDYRVYMMAKDEIPK